MIRKVLLSSIRSPTSLYKLDVFANQFSHLRLTYALYKNVDSVAHENTWRQTQRGSELFERGHVLG